MKSYILLKPEAVQNQLSNVCAQAKPFLVFIGLDVHNDSIAVSLAPSDSTVLQRSIAVLEGR
jgi:hypothetical protein